MDRHRLTDEQWSRIGDLFDTRKHTGRPPNDRRQMLDGVLWVLNTGAPWRDLPAELGRWSTVWDLFDRWNADGTLAAVLHRLQGEVEINGDLWCIDGTTVRAHRCASGGGKKGTPTSRRITRWGAAVAV
jgi:transposase